MYTVDLVSREEAQPYEERKRCLGQLLNILAKRHVTVPLIASHDMGGTLLMSCCPGWQPSCGWWG